MIALTEEVDVDAHDYGAPGLRRIDIRCLAELCKQSTERSSCKTNALSQKNRRTRAQSFVRIDPRFRDEVTREGFPMDSWTDRVTTMLKQFCLPLLGLAAVVLAGCGGGDGSVGVGQGQDPDPGRARFPDRVHQGAAVRRGRRPSGAYRLARRAALQRRHRSLYAGSRIAHGRRAQHYVPRDRRAWATCRVSRSRSTAKRSCSRCAARSTRDWISTTPISRTGASGNTRSPPTRCGA